MQDFLHWIEQTGLENIVWITDVDETLLEKAANPNEVTQVPGLEDLCERLDAKAGGGFFVITGREFPWLDKVFPKKTIRASCEYHCLFRKAAGAEPEALNPRPQWNLIDAELEALAAQHDGLLLRKKPFMRSLHYIGVPKEQRNTVKAALEPALKGLLEKHNKVAGQNVGIIDGGKVFDMGPSDSDKSHALKDILAEAQAQAGKKLIPVYFGDSPGDLPAAAAAQAADGKFIAIGDDDRVICVADFTFSDPAEYREAIRWIVNPAPKPESAPTGPKLP